MPRPRPLLAALAALSLCAMWAVPAQHFRLIALRELYRFGEFIGFTTTSVSGGRLAGQVMGFNYSEPPGWYHFIAHALSAACALAPALLPALWLRRRLAGPHPMPHASLGAVALRVLAPLALAALAWATLHLTLGWWTWEQCIRLGKWLGGSVTNASGHYFIGPGGPFRGDTTADTLGNALSRWGAELAVTIAACAAALTLHAILCGRAAKRARARGLCIKCGYDRRGLATAALCPECGTRPATVEPGAAA